MASLHSIMTPRPSSPLLSRTYLLLLALYCFAGLALPATGKLTHCKTGFKKGRHAATLMAAGQGGGGLAAPPLHIAPCLVRPTRFCPAGRSLQQNTTTDSTSVAVTGRFGAPAASSWAPGVQAAALETLSQKYAQKKCWLSLTAGDTTWLGPDGARVSATPGALASVEQCSLALTYAVDAAGNVVESATIPMGDIQCLAGGEPTVSDEVGPATGGREKYLAVLLLLGEQCNLSFCDNLHARLSCTPNHSAVVPGAMRAQSGGVQHRRHPLPRGQLLQLHHIL